MANARTKNAGQGLGSGVFEDQIHLGSGLRNIQQVIQIAKGNARAATSDTLTGPLSSLVHAGATAPVNTSGWTEIPLVDLDPTSGARRTFKRKLPLPITPCVSVRNVNGVPANIPANRLAAFRLHGIDQFGQPVTDEVVWLTLNGGASAQRCIIFFNEVFAYVTKFEYQFANRDGTNDRIELGYYVPWFSGTGTATFTENATTNVLIYQGNWGFGLPFRLQRGDTNPPSTTLYSVIPEFQGGTVLDHATNSLFPLVPRGVFTAGGFGGIVLGVQDANWPASGSKCPHKWKPYWTIADVDPSAALYDMGGVALLAADLATKFTSDGVVTIVANWRQLRGSGLKGTLERSVYAT